MMRRQLNSFAIRIVNSFYSARPTRLRKAVSVALCFTLVLVPLLGHGTPVTPMSKVAAQGPTPTPTPPPINFCGGTTPATDPTRIIQPCSSLDVGLVRELEKEVVDSLLAAHQLPPDDKSRLLGWERNLIRAGIYNKILGYAKKSPASRTVSEQLWVTRLTDLVKQRRILSATKAIDEYNRWASNPCTFIAPTGFSYSLHCSCFNQFCGIFDGPTPPTFEEFQNYGASIAYDDYKNPAIQAIAGDTARNLGILGGFAAVGLAGVIGGVVGASLTAGSLVIAAIHPFLAFVIAGTGEATAVAAAGATAAGVTGAVSIAAVAAIVILAVVIGVLQGITVFTAAAIPGKLQEAKTNAVNANIDIAQLITTDTGNREVYAEFIDSTLPDFPATTGVPAAAAGDKSFLVQPGGIVTTTIQYKDWNEKVHTARLSEGWFVDKKETDAEKLTLSIQYVDWTGKGWTASRSGNKFLHTRTGDATATPFESPEIKYKDATGAFFIARINIVNASPTLSTTSATANPSASIISSQVIGTVSDPDDLPDTILVSVLSENPSNGVTLETDLHPFQGNVTARFRATCSASNTSFTIRVTDPAGSSATGTINVTVTPNQPPVLAYLSPPGGVNLGSTFSLNPFKALSDPDGEPSPTIGTPTISPAGFAGSVSVSPTGVLQITNASPPGVYTIKIPVSDNCTTIEAPFIFNVLCPAISGAVSGGGQILPGATAKVSVNVSGGTAPYTVKLSDNQMKTSSTLPIVFDISANNLPLATPINYTATATDAYGCPVTVTGSATVTVVDNISPNISCPANAIATLNLQQGTAMVSPGTATATDNVTASPTITGARSDGLPLSSPYPKGVTSITWRATDEANNPSTCTQTVTVNCPVITLSPAGLSDGTAGVYYHASISATPSSTYSFTVSQGALPNGLTLNPSNGALSGTPTASGTFSFRVTATGAGSCSGSRDYQLTISCPVVTLSASPLANGTLGSNYAQMVSATPAGGNYSFALTGGALPPGLELAPNGQISGIPNQTGSFSFRLTATGFDTCSNARDYQLTVVCPVITLSAGPLAAGTLGAAYSRTLSATGAGGNYTFAMASGALPPGLSLNKNGLISGMPTQSGIFNFRVSATGAGGCSGTASYSIRIDCPAITLVPASLPGGNVGSEYHQTLGVSPAGSYSFSITSGALPTGLTFNQTNGEITGMPSATGTFNFIVNATSGGCSGSRSYTITIACPTIAFTPTSLSAGEFGTAYHQMLSVTLSGTYSFSIFSGSLPGGLMLNAMTGEIKGMPAAAGTFTFTVKAQRAGGCTATQTYSLVINCPPITLNPETLPAGRRGAFYSQTISATPAGGTYSYAVTSGSLPTGLNLNSMTGALSGTPTVNGTYNFTIRATRAGSNCSGTRSYTVTISNPGMGSAVGSDDEGDGRRDYALSGEEEKD